MAQNSLYLNIWDYISAKYPFQIFIGGRGTGKTYSGLSGALTRHNAGDIGNFIYMRRTTAEIELTLDNPGKGEGANPFKPINRNLGTNVGLSSISDNVAGIYNRIEEDGKLSPSGAPIGYGVALSTLSSVRGFDFSDCTDCFYDEFIPEGHVRKLKGDECVTLLNSYESINRNREFDGCAPMRLWLLANSNNIYTPILIGLGIVGEIEKMVHTGKQHRYIEDRGLAIHLITNNAEFVDKKKETALYKLTKGTQFYEMALENKFAYNDFSLIAHKNITGYRPVCAVDTAFIYKKKGSGEYYVSYAPAQCQHFDGKTEQDKRFFCRNYGCHLLPYFMSGNIWFESFELKQKILDLIL